MSLVQPTFLEQATFWVALGSLLVGLAATTVAWVYGENSRRQQHRHHEEQRALAEEQLQLAREQAEMRPDLEVVVCKVRRHRYPAEKGTLQVVVANSGKVAAHNARGWIYFHKDFFGPPKQPSSLQARVVELQRRATTH